MSSKPFKKMICVIFYDQTEYESFMRCMPIGGTRSDHAKTLIAEGVKQRRGKKPEMSVNNAFQKKSK